MAAPIILGQRHGGVGWPAPFSAAVRFLVRDLYPSRLGGSRNGRPVWVGREPPTIGVVVRRATAWTACTRRHYSLKVSFIYDTFFESGGKFCAKTSIFTTHTKPSPQTLPIPRPLTPCCGRGTVWRRSLLSLSHHLNMLETIRWASKYINNSHASSWLQVPLLASGGERRAAKRRGASIDAESFLSQSYR